MATAETELESLIAAAHALGMYVILDIVLNNSARVFDYVFDCATQADFTSQEVMNKSFGAEPDVRWLNGLGFPRVDWTNVLPSTGLSADDAVWPRELQRAAFFRGRATSSATAFRRATTASSGATSGSCGSWW